LGIAGRSDRFHREDDWCHCGYRNRDHPVIEKMEGVAQNQPVQNREGVTQGLRESKLPDAGEMVNLIDGWQ